MGKSTIYRWINFFEESPDLSTVENVWAMIKDHLYERLDKIPTRDDIFRI